MAKVVPLRGVRYNTEVAGSMPDLVTPPYDVIDLQAQRAFYGKNPYNIIRLEYGEIRPVDDPCDNRYTRAAAFFRHWLSLGVLRHDNNPSFYIYEQEFSVGERRITRSGLICGVGVEDYETGMVLPHEETLSKAKADRLELLRSCHANFSPIFGLYEDSELSVEEIAAPYRQHPPLLSFTDEHGEAHRLWLIDRPEDTSRIPASFATKKIYIADGHHRYETALAFHKEMQAAGNGQFGFVLMTLVNLYDPGLLILPTHRLVKNVAGFDADALLKKLTGVFSVREIRIPKETREETVSHEMSEMQALMPSQHAFGLYTGRDCLYRLTLPRGSGEFTAEQSQAWRELDVSVLQCLVLEGMLNIDREARQSGSNLAYTRSEAEALEGVDQGLYQAAFLLNPPQVREVLSVAAAGDKMPQKSTYFYPKLITGLVINDFSL